jgi:P-type Cu2+ transporter
VTETLDLSMFVRRHEGTAHMDLAVEGLGCAGCIRKIEGGLKQLPGVVEARLNFTNRRLAVDWHEEELAAVDVIAALDHIG